MGTDIHLQVQRRNSDGTWVTAHPPEGYNENDSWVAQNYKEEVAKLPEGVTVEDVLAGNYNPKAMAAYYIRKYHREWYNGRNYNLFAMLADVRNGSGFAGVLTGNGFVPISYPRGLPEDVINSQEYDEETDDYIGFYYGDHSYSYLTLKELLDYNWEQTTRLCGVISLDEFIKRQESNITSSPEDYCGDIWGHNCVTLDEQEAKDLLNNNDFSPTDTQIKYYVRVWWEQTYRESASWFCTHTIPALQTLDPNPENVRLVFGFDS